MNISERIKEYREKKLLTQQEVADKLNMTQASYQYLEKRDKKLTIEQIQKIADVLGVSLKEIISGEVDNDSKKIEEENTLLKKTIEDKETIITHLRHKNSQFEYIIESSFKDFADLLAEELHIGHIRVLDNKSKDFGLLFPYSKEKDYEYYDQKYERFTSILTDDDMQKIVSHLCQNNIFFRVFHSAYDFTRKTKLDIISDWFEAFEYTEEYREYLRQRESIRNLRK